MKTMKRMILAAALMIAASGAKAQDTDISKDEFGFSLGFGTQVMHDGNYIDMRHYVERQLGWVEGGTGPFYNIGVSLGGEYYRQISNPIAVGLTGGFALANCQYEIPDEVVHQEKEVELTSVYVMPAVRWTWFRYNKVRLYSKACLGLQWQNMEIRPNSYQLNTGLKSHQTKLAYHLGAAGAELGHKNCHVFFEVGYGICGVVNLGIHFSF